MKLCNKPLWIFGGHRWGFCDCKTKWQKDQEKQLNRLIHYFSKILKLKLRHVVRTKNKEGWDNPDWTVEQIKQQIIEHVEKGDPRDVAILAAFWWNKQE